MNEIIKCILNDTINKESFIYFILSYFRAVVAFEVMDYMTLE